MNKPFISTLLITSCLSCFAPYAQAQDNTLQLKPLGNPTSNYRQEARKINDLKFFHNKLYVGYGDYSVNTGPTDVIYYDMAKKEFVKEFTVQEEAIDKYQIVDDTLVITGVDATEDWTFGNIYTLTDKGWIKHRTIPNGIHVFDAVSLKNKWYVVTGNFFKFTEKDIITPGVIMSSADKCESWKFEYSTSAADNLVYRINSIVAYKDKIYAFPYAYTTMEKNEIPKEYREYIGKPYVTEKDKDYYLISADNAFGKNNAIVYDKSWMPLKLIPAKNVYNVKPFIFKNRLVMSVVCGKYIARVNEYVEKNGKLPPNVDTSLYSFDGKVTELIPFDYDFIKDVLVQDDKLSLLIFKKGKYLIAQTQDLKNWQYFNLPSNIGKPLSIEYNNGSFYIGTDDGNIWFN